MTYYSENSKMVLRKYNLFKHSLQLPRIVFFLTLNGRSSRQVFRLIKSIYDDYHYFYFHVDQV